MIPRKRLPVIAVLIVVSAFVPLSAFSIPGTDAVRRLAAPSFSVEKYIRTELYFGLARKGGAEVSESEFQTFIDEFVTLRFPDGLTIVDGRGQWRESDRTITRERSKVLILIYPKRDKHAASRKIDEIREEYKKRFAQSSVLRVDTGKSLSVSF